MQYLEQLDDQHDDTLDHLSLYRASVRKEEDATAVLTEQVGFDDVF